MDFTKPSSQLLDISLDLDPDPVIEEYKKHIDMTLIEENLKLTVEQRLLKLMDAQDFFAEVRRAGKEMRRS